MGRPSRQICLSECANLNLNRPNLGREGRTWNFEMQFQCFFQIGQSLIFRLTLAGNIQIQALRDVPVFFFPNRDGELAFHAYIVSQGL